MCYSYQETAGPGRMRLARIIHEGHVNNPGLPDPACPQDPGPGRGDDAGKWAPRVPVPRDGCSVEIQERSLIRVGPLTSSVLLSPHYSPGRFHEQCWLRGYESVP